ncbi:MAG: hypothetical protein ABMB14_38620, partial [Myxococcota bacterium]
MSDDRPRSRRAIRALYVRGVAWVHVLALCSLLVQVDVLFGAGGILPLDRWLAAIRADAGGPWA